MIDGWLSPDFSAFFLIAAVPCARSSPLLHESRIISRLRRMKLMTMAADGVVVAVTTASSRRSRTLTRFVDRCRVSVLSLTIGLFHCRIVLAGFRSWPGRTVPQTVPLAGVVAAAARAQCRTLYSPLPPPNFSSISCYNSR